MSAVRARQHPPEDMKQKGLAIMQAPFFRLVILPPVGQAGYAQSFSSLLLSSCCNISDVFVVFKPDMVMVAKAAGP